MEDTGRLAYIKPFIESTILFPIITPPLNHNHLSKRTEQPQTTLHFRQYHSHQPQIFQHEVHRHYFLHRHLLRQRDRYSYSERQGCRYVPLSSIHALFSLPFKQVQANLRIAAEMGKLKARDCEEPKTSDCLNDCAPVFCLDGCSAKQLGCVAFCTAQYC